MAVQRLPWMLYHWHPCDYENWNAMPDVKRYLHLHCSGRGIFGQDGDDVSWGHADRLMFEMVIARHKFDSIAEFGTWKGVSSLYFGVTAATMSIPFWTCDIKDNRLQSVKNAWLHNMDFCETNLLGNPPSDQAIYQISKSRNTLLIVDNGNKEMEAEVYGKYLSVGSGMIIHDWGTEVRPEVTSAVLRGMGFENMYSDFGATFGSCCSFWMKGK